MRYTKEDLLHWIDAIKMEASDSLSGWEMNFVSNVDSQLQRTGRLSERQVEILERIYTEHTN